MVIKYKEITKLRNEVGRILTGSLEFQDTYAYRELNEIALKLDDLIKIYQNFNLEAQGKKKKEVKSYDLSSKNKSR